MSLGIMFHHFHGKNFKKMQGSISSNQFNSIIKYLKKKYTILNPDIFFKNIQQGNLKKKNICITFDDCLKSQISIALPILNKFKIRAFFFIYSGILTNKIDKFEIYRDFRSTAYKSIDSFYNDFFEIIISDYKKDLIKFNKTFDSNYLKKFKFYSFNDRKYRFYRDNILSEKKYEIIMNSLIKKKNYNSFLRYKKILMNKFDLNKLINSGHEIGLHSHSHPVRFDLLNYNQQLYEYHTNQKILNQISKKNIYSMSHPCGRYNKHTIKVLKKLNIKLGFRSNNHIKKVKSIFEVPRIDHTEILKKIISKK